MNTEHVSVYLGLGSNVGDRKQNLERAINFVSERMNVEKVSSVYDTAPEINPNQPRFLNMVALARTTLDPQVLLSLLKGIESKLGRVPSTPYSPRPMDIDILFYGKEIIDSPALTIPHPHIQERAFVLVPLDEIASGLKHPVNGKTAKQMLADLKSGLQGVFKFLPPPETESAKTSGEEN